MFKSWNEMTVVEQLQASFWDMYKDVYGVRPWHVDCSNPKWGDEQFLRNELDKLSVEMDRIAREDIEREQRSIVKFEAEVQHLIDVVGAPDRKTAIRWIHDAEGTQDDHEYLCYIKGLPYDYFGVDDAAQIQE